MKNPEEKIKAAGEMPAALHLPGFGS